MKIHITTFFLLIVFAAQAQSFGVPRDETSLRKNIIEASKNISTIQSNFVQEKVSSMLAEKAISKGAFFFKKENKVKLEYKEPFNYLVIMNNGKAFIKDDDKSREINLNRSRTFQQMNKIIVDCINGNVLSSMDFQTRLYENNQQIKMQIAPVSKTAKSFLSSIVVVLEKSDYSAARIEMYEASGDKTILLFSNKTINGVVEDTQFAFE